VDGEWRDVQVTRHYGKAGRFEHSAHLNEDEHDDFRSQGFEEYTTRPPEKFQQLYVTANGGKTWEIDLPAYKQMVILCVKAEALRRARQSFNPSAFEVVFKTVESEIVVAGDTAGVDEILKTVYWPE
jgi:hypothetical protein